MILNSIVTNGISPALMDFWHGIKEYLQLFEGFRNTQFYTYITT